MSFELFAESFGAYSLGSFTDSAIQADILSRWTNGAGLSAVIVATGRNGPGITLNNFELGKTLTHSSIWTGGFAIKVSGGIVGNDPIFNIKNNNTVLFQITHNTDGTLSIRAGNTTIIGVTSRALHLDSWYWIDFTITIGGGSPVTCTAEIRINSNIEASGSGSTLVNNTALTSGDATANNFSLVGLTGGSGGTITISDFYLKNSVGYYGDVIIQPLVPNGDVVTDWTPSTGGTHYVLVNSIPVDRTKYVTSDTIDQQDIFDWQDCPGFTGTVKAINIRVLAKKDDEGEKSFKIVVGDTGTEAESDEFFVSDLSEEFYEYSLETDPATSLEWTQTGFNAKRFGIKLIS